MEKKQTIRVNLNNYIRFMLNDRGKEIYSHRNDKENEYIKTHNKDKDTHLKLLPTNPPKVDEQGFSTFQLWEFMEIFGSYVSMGLPNIWVDRQIYLYIDDYEVMEMKQN